MHHKQHPPLSSGPGLQRDAREAHLVVPHDRGAILLVLLARVHDRVEVGAVVACAPHRTAARSAQPNSA
eukprot:4653284-Prymnesium_polylepis.1